MCIEPFQRILRVPQDPVTKLRQQFFALSLHNPT